MTRNRRPTVAETRLVISQLTLALKDLRIFTDPNHTMCNVDPATRDEAEPYLRSWVDDPVQVALNILRRSVPPTD